MLFFLIHTQVLLVVLTTFCGDLEIQDAAIRKKKTVANLKGNNFGCTIYTPIDVGWGRVQKTQKRIKHEKSK